MSPGPQCLKERRLGDRGSGGTATARAGITCAAVPDGKCGARGPESRGAGSVEGPGGHPPRDPRGVRPSRAEEGVGP